MSTKKARGLSQESVMDAILNPPRKVPALSKNATDSKSVQNSPAAGKSRVEQSAIDLKIANPGYSEEQRKELVSGDRLSTTARVPTMLRLMLKKPVVLKNPCDPEFSRIDEISMLKLSLFMLNGISDAKLKEYIEFCDSLPSKGDTIPVKVSSLFVKDFVEDGIYRRIRQVSKSDTKRMFSFVVRLGMVMLGKMSEDGVLDEALKQAKDLQFKYGLNLVSG